MKKLYFIIAASSALLIAQASSSNEEEHYMPPKTLLSVADFNGDGSVNGRDIIRLARTHRGEYQAFFDYNADGDLDRRDIKLAIKDIGKNSTALDQQIVQWFNKFGHMHNKTIEDVIDYGFSNSATPLAGHGAHWFNQEGLIAALPYGVTDINSLQGLNIDSSCRGLQT